MSALRLLHVNGVGKIADAHGGCGRPSLRFQMAEDRPKQDTRILVGVACNKPAITRNAESGACGLAGRDKSPLG